MARRRRQAHELERVLGTNALFATAYGNVGSSIYYALGVVAVYALGLTPIVFILAGVIFACTAATYAEGTVSYPEAGGSSSFARHAFNETISFEAAWAQMLNYIATIAVSAFFVPHYLSVFWAPLRQNPWDIVVGVVVIAVLVVVNIVGVQESAKLNVVLAVVDFGTQVLLVLLGFVLVFSPHVLVSNVHLGVAPTWASFLLAIPVAMLAYTGIETVSNMAEEVRDPVRTVPRAVLFVAIAVFAIYFTLPWVALSALPVFHDAHGYTTCLAAPPTTMCQGEPGYQNDPVLGVVNNLGLGAGITHVLQVYLGILAATILFIGANAGVIGASRITYAMSGYRQLPTALPPDPPEVQDAVGRARRLRRDDPDPPHAHRQDRVPRGDLLVRCDVLVHHRARLHRPAADEAEGRRGRDRLQAAGQHPLARGRVAGVRDHRRARDGAVVDRDRRPEPDDPLRGPRLARARARVLHRLPPLRAPPADDARRSAPRSSSGARRRSSSGRSSSRSRPATRPTRRWTSRAGSRPSGAPRSSR